MRDPLSFIFLVSPGSSRVLVAVGPLFPELVTGPSLQACHGNLISLVNGVGI